MTTLTVMCLILKWFLRLNNLGAKKLDKIEIIVVDYTT
jgi:hypothetical protein